MSLFLLAGCNADGSGREFRTRNPKSGSVKILVTKLDDTSDTQRWQWYIIGDRNWTKPVAAPDGLLELSDTYPLNTVNDRNGTFTWYAELIVRRSAGTDKTVWETVLHGTNGVTVKAKGDGTAQNGRIVRIRRDKDESPNMPTEVELAKVIGGPTIRLRLGDK